MRGLRGLPDYWSKALLWTVAGFMSVFIVACSTDASATPTPIASPTLTSEERDALECFLLVTQMEVIEEEHGILTDEELVVALMARRGDTAVELMRSMQDCNAIIQEERERQ